MFRQNDEFQKGIPLSGGLEAALATHAEVFGKHGRDT